VRPQKSLIRFHKGAKLSPKHVGPFEIIERKGSIFYHLALPSSLDCMHDFFPIFVLHHHIPNSSHVINLYYLQMLYEGTLMV
jgi:hypothetical protein